jgi:hypothetical protein
MRILYVGPYRQKDGWGGAAEDFALALIKSKHDVAIRPVYMSNSLGPINQLLQPFENKRLDGYDCIIQQVLPHMFDYCGDKTIGMFFSETGNLQYTGWPKHCNMMDEIWVSSEAERTNLTQSGVCKPIKKIPIPVNTDKFERSYEKLILPTFAKTFNFYTISELTKRKNVATIAIAFHLEFHPQEPVNLILKVHRGGMHPQQTQQLLRDELAYIKTNFRIYARLERYKPEIILTDFMKEEDLYKLHVSGDCFVSASHGEAWCRPAIDAMGFGNTPIVTGNTGMEEFINNETGWVVPAHEAPVLCDDPPIANLYTAKETWQNIDITELRKAMREAYENKQLKQQKKVAGMTKVYDYTYDKVASILNESC